METFQNCILFLLPYFYSFMFGGIAGYVELIEHSPEGPSRIFWNFASYVYMGVNAGMSLFAYWLIVSLDIHPYKDKQSVDEVFKVLIAGFSAMVFLRSTFLKYKDFNFGIMPILDAVLNSVINSFERKRSNLNAKELDPIMRNVDFDKAKVDLTSLCLHLQKHSMSEGQSKAFGEEVEGISRSTNMNITKSIMLGDSLLRVSGLELLKRAKGMIGDKIILTEDEEKQKDKIRILELQEELKKLSKEIGQRK